jgi:hypothetical protein
VVTIAATHGWYFYGITRCAPLPAAIRAADDDAVPVQLLEFSELAAVVRPVPLVDFTPDALNEHLHDASALETMVRSHNRVIEAIHAQQAILPAKFGMVHARAEDVVSALRPAHDSLLQRLSRLEECDEWAVHVYADRATTRERIAVEDEAMRRLREERGAARPGRAYFLAQQLRDALDSATEDALSTLAQDTFDRLAIYAVDAEVNPVSRPAALVAESEILRASFLVRRDATEQFAKEVHSCIDGRECLRCDCSGPWPPYSFADQHEEEAE